ncbi:hypothetical protein BDR04DRAFT_1096680 [Suillus decipiens]|nr:hypothetical protein BDR04DRAFT_1096680 [Suillus decipiens]
MSQSKNSSPTDDYDTCRCKPSCGKWLPNSTRNQHYRTLINDELGCMEDSDSDQEDDEDMQESSSSNDESKSFHTGSSDSEDVMSIDDGRSQATCSDTDCDGESDLSRASETPFDIPDNLIMSPGMVPGPGHNMMIMMANITLQHRQSMTATTKNLLAAAASGASEQRSHLGQQQFVRPRNNRIGQNLAQATPMGGMALPAPLVMGGPMKDQKDVKPMINNPSATQEGLPQNAFAALGRGGPSPDPTESVHSTALPIPNTINSSITESPAPNGTPSVPLASIPASQPQSNLSDLPLNFMSSDFMQSMTALEDLYSSMFRTDFEQDFREWFDPDGVSQSDLPPNSMSSDFMQSMSQSDLPPNFMSSDFLQSMSALEDLDTSMFRTDFEQDFREWFDPTNLDSK